jgi:membrane glycosyltransferase
MLVALLWGGVLFLVNRSFFWWLVPVLGPLVFAVPLSVWSSRVSLGKIAERMGLFLIAEELSPPAELAAGEAPCRQELDTSEFRGTSGFVLAVTDPYVNALHLAFRRRKRKAVAGIPRSRQLVEKALAGGPESLLPREKIRLLSEPESLDLLHVLVWQLPGGEAARQWGLYDSPAASPPAAR